MRNVKHYPVMYREVSQLVREYIASIEDYKKGI